MIVKLFAATLEKALLFEKQAGLTSYSIFPASKMQVVTIQSIEQAPGHAKDEW
jgi:hypothetical protein